jgi:hypothetical protein
VLGYVLEAVFEEHMTAQVGHSRKDLVAQVAQRPSLQVTVLVVIPRLFAPKAFLTKFTGKGFDGTSI